MSDYRRIPRDRSLDAAPALLREGYTYVSRRCERMQTDVFRARVALRETIFLSGPEAARLFYDSDRFQRQGAAPRRVRKTLFGEGGVQGLDGLEHRERKALFLSLMAPAAIAELEGLFDRQVDAAVDGWAEQEEVVLLLAVREVLTRAACAWAGIPLPEQDVPLRASQLADLVDAAAAFGPRHWRGRRARTHTERWLAGLVRDVRARRLHVDDHCALALFASHRKLDPRVVAVELLNVVRPIVAIDRYVVFVALALHEHPEWRQRLLEGRNGEVERFVLEVRRLAPFFPMVVAVARRDFEWRGYRFRRGTRAVLDLYGTNRDPRSWADPDCFRPERFLGWDGSPYDLVPQGGGTHATGHRCPGEWITVAVMERAARWLTAGLTYTLPAQDLSVSLSQIPAGPRSGFVMAGVRRAEARRRGREPIQSAPPPPP